jgi:hypothetical protein
MPSISNSETGQALRARAALASKAGGDDRANGAASATAASGGPPRSSVPDPAGARTLELLVSDFARVLGCEVALVCELDGDSSAQVVCASGIDRPVAITISRRGGRRRSAAARTGGAVSLAGRSPKRAPGLRDPRPRSRRRPAPRGRHVPGRVLVWFGRRHVASPRGGRRRIWQSQRSRSPTKRSRRFRLVACVS